MKYSGTRLQSRERKDREWYGNLVLTVALHVVECSEIEKASHGRECIF
jgi:hypothetical protein